MDRPATPRSRKLARMTDIARMSAVSSATVDRVLNRRPGVRPATIERVLKAALELGYVLEADAAAALSQKPMRIVFLLPEGDNRFLSLLGRAVAQSAHLTAPYNVKCRVEFIGSFNPDLLARHLAQQGREADGIAFMALEHPAVREAVNTLADRGVPTVTLISDMANARRAAYVGLDNRSVGRTAGYLIARFIGARSAKVAMIAGSRSYRAHEEREMGFLHLFEEMYPSIEVVGLREGLDNEARNYRHTRTLLSQHPDLAGIYNIGGAPEGVVRALREHSREREVVFIGHGLTPGTRGFLLDGAMDAVITQNPVHTVVSCAAVFANLRAGREAAHEVEAPRIEIVFRENLP
jgi:LacI family transcriptional regulator